MGFALIALVWACSPSLAQEAKDPEDVLQDFQADLLQAIRTAPKDLAVRSKLTAAARTVFDRDLRAAVVRVQKIKWDWHQQFMEHLIVSEKQFGDPGNKSERSLWNNACKTVFAVQLSHATEPETKPSTDELFGELYTAVDKVRKNFHTATAGDLRTLAYTAAKQIFTDRLATARVSARDPQSAYAAQIIRIDRDYPLPQASAPKEAAGSPSAKGGGGKSSGGSPGVEKKDIDYHTEPNQILKTAAKAAFDRALAAPK